MLSYGKTREEDIQKALSYLERPVSDWKKLAQPIFDNKDLPSGYACAPGKPRAFGTSTATPKVIDPDFQAGQFSAEAYVSIIQFEPEALVTEDDLLAAAQFVGQPYTQWIAA
ncbi:MAG: hypothetical protein ACRDAM_15910 [Casimicrobium sp.]